MGEVIYIDGDLYDVDEELLDISRLECKESLSEFVRQAWHVIEPGSEYIHNWHIDFIAEHLQAITDEVELDDGSPYNRLAIAIVPGAMKSLMVNVFWPSWELGPMGMSHMRYICVSHSQELAIRDGLKMRRLIESDWYQERWGKTVKIAKDQNQKQKFEFEGGGFRQCCAAGSITGARADRVIVDDMLSVQDATSKQIMESTTQQFFEAIPTRLVNPKKSAIVVIQQRLAENDIIGSIKERGLPYDHIMLPMRYEAARAEATMLGMEDPRSEEGELLFPDRFPIDVVERDEAIMGRWATAAQFQQNPIPRGGGVIQAEWWREFEGSSYPPFSYVIAAVDGAFTVKQENDPSAMTVWGVWDGGDQMALPTRSINTKGEIIYDKERVYQVGKNSVMLIYAWAERLEFHELVERVRDTMLTYSVDKLLVENKANGYSIAQEMRRLYGHEDFGVQLVDPKGLDKLARLYAVQHLFTDGLIYAPDTQFARMVINEVSTFPKGRHDDLTDTTSMALTYLRQAGLLTRQAEHVAQMDREMEHSGHPADPLYPV